MPERRPRPRNLVRAGLTHDLQRRLGEAEQAGGADRVGAEHAAGRLTDSLPPMAVSPANFAAPDLAGLIPTIKGKLKKISTGRT